MVSNFRPISFLLPRPPFDFSDAPAIPPDQAIPDTQVTMLGSLPVLAAAVLVAVQPVWGYPGMEKQLAEIMSRDDGGSDSTELLGDLLTLSDSQLTPTGKDVKLILSGGGSAQTGATWSAPSLGSSACQADTCCVWQYIVNDMVGSFRGSSGRCTGLARRAVRLGFHDAAAWSKTTAQQKQPGGADGSICLTTEVKRSENDGLQDACDLTTSWYNKWNKQKGYKSVTMADLIQMGANVATVVCPLGPRVKSYVGRVDNAQQNPAGLIPLPSQSAPDLVALFRAKTIGPLALTALVGAHTTSQQFFVDPSRAGDPQDSTPGVWDTLFYSQVLGTTPAPPRVFKFQSDVALSQYSETAGEWKKFAGPGGQVPWNEDYARGYIRLSLLGVNNINDLTECSKVLPQPTGSFNNPDQSNLNKWLNSKGLSAAVTKISNAIHDGESLLGWVINLVNGVIKGVNDLLTGIIGIL